MIGTFYTIFIALQKERYAKNEIKVIKEEVKKLILEYNKLHNKHKDQYDKVNN